MTVIIIQYIHSQKGVVPRWKYVVTVVTENQKIELWIIGERLLSQNDRALYGFNNWDHGDADRKLRPFFIAGMLI